MLGARVPQAALNNRARVIDSRIAYAGRRADTRRIMGVPETPRVSLAPRLRFSPF